jgi:hypothetical protein
MMNGFSHFIGRALAVKTLKGLVDMALWVEF